MLACTALGSLDCGMSPANDLELQLNLHLLALHLKAAMGNSLDSNFLPINHNYYFHVKA